MLFSYDFTIPASTTETAPYTEFVRLDTGTLTGCKVRFKAGCHNRVFFAVYDGLRQIVPAHQTNALYGDNVTFEIPMNYEMNSKPYELTLKGWSPSTRYDHTLSLWFDILESAIEKKSGGLSQFLHLLGGS